MTKIINGCAISLNNAAKPKKLSLKYFNLGLFSVIAAVGVFYLFNISALTAQGFILRELKSRAMSLASSQADQEEKVSLAQSYYSVNARAGSLNMIAVGDVEYLSSANLSLAKK
ncbi:MAG: hypothetical protein WC863_04515 [Patescibacteria group bacterium]